MLASGCYSFIAETLHFGYNGAAIAGFRPFLHLSMVHLGRGRRTSAWSTSSLHFGRGRRTSAWSTSSLHFGRGRRTSAWSTPSLYFGWARTDRRFPVCDYYTGN